MDLLGRKRKAAKEKRDAESKAYWARMQPIFDEEKTLLDAENERYKALIVPLEKEHMANVMKIFDAAMKKMDAVQW